MDLFPNPSPSSSSSGKSKAARIFFMSMGFLSTLVLLKVVIIPFASDFVLSTFPRLFTSAKTSLSPAFVLITLNFIIISIVASSSFHHRKTTASSAAAEVDFTTESDYPIPDFTQSHEAQPEKQSNHPEKEEKEEEKAVLEDSVLSKCANDYVSPEADDTLDATWRAIMEGQGKMEKPKLKKSDTCGGRIEKAKPFIRDINGDDGGDGDDEEDDDDPVAWARKELKKSETFNDTVSLRRDKSMSPEELNLRAEAFIQNFINQMRLQRLESEQRFMELVNRSA